MHKLSEIIKRNKKNIAQKGYDYYIITSLWDNVVEKYLRERTSPTKIISGRLYVNVLEPILAQQLNLLKKNIIEKINKKLGKEKIKNILFQIGDVEKEKKKDEVKEKTAKNNKYINSKKKENILMLKGIKTTKLEELYKKSNKYKKIMKEKGHKECIECGAIFFGEKEVCYRCQQAEKYDKIKDLIKCLSKTPWINPEEMGVSDGESHENFLLCKSILLREKEERLRNCTAFKKEIDINEKQYLKLIAQEYVEIKTGFKPNELNEDVMKNNLPQRVYKLLFNERKHK